MFTKVALQNELLEFIQTHSAAMGRIFSTPILDEEQAKLTPIFKICSDLYSYAFQGESFQHPHYKMGEGNPIDGVIADIEMFLLACKRPGAALELYFQEDSVPKPAKAIATIQAAVARHVLDGGERYTDQWDTALNALSFTEIALLADIDEKSVRNAANPKTAEPLATTVDGKRTGIEVEVARAWLSKRRGFTPTKI